jgi:hypothetical protein
MSEPIRPGIYRHYKGGRYRVLFTAVHTEAREVLVIYQDVVSGLHWARPASMWAEDIEPGVRRFTWEGP